MNKLIKLKESRSVEVTVLQDNYVDVFAGDSSDVVKRPVLAKRLESGDLKLTSSPIAEFGFSSFITVSADEGSRSVLFDFGCSPSGALFNADLLSVDLESADELVLSHGHLDHFGGLGMMAERLKGKKLYMHPGAFRKKRYIRIPGGKRLYFPELSEETIEEYGVIPEKTSSPRLILGGYSLFLGEIPERCSFEKGMENAFYEEEGTEKKDCTEDDTALVFNVADKGLVIISGCAHSGIVNTVEYAAELTGISRIYAVAGGFHLTGDAYKDRIDPTVDALKKFNPEYIVPAHCTGRDACRKISEEMPEQYLMSMSGTKFIF